MGPENQIKLNLGLFVPLGKEGPFPVIFSNDLVWLEHLGPIARKILDRGYIFAGFDRHDLDADNADRSDGVHPLY